MKIKDIFIVCTLILVMALLQCKEKPSFSTNFNPLDPDNPATEGDPFRLQASLANGGVTLIWNKLEIANLNGYHILRTGNESGPFNKLDLVNAETHQYVDSSVQNGSSYWYKVTALSASGYESSATNVAAVQILTAPMFSINSGALSTADRTVNLTILAATARQMWPSNFADFADGNWEPYAAGTSWTLLTGVGKKTVYLKVKYSDNKESTVAEASIELVEKLSIMTHSPLPDGVVRTTYDQTLQASGGKAPYTWSKICCTLPAGIDLDPSGKLYGSPSACGTYIFTVQVKDDYGMMANEQFYLTIQPAKPQIDWVTVPGGTFKMGDLFGDGFSDELPTHQVKLSTFNMSKYEITNEQYAVFLNDYGSANIKSGSYAGQTMIYEHEWGVKKVNDRWQPVAGYEKYPIVVVTWYGAYEFSQFYKFRLPTEAEWEYAARNGGRNEKWAGTSQENKLGEYAWYSVNSGRTTHAVGTMKPDGLGLYDMSGNVNEWCADWYDESYYNSSPIVNPQGLSSGLVRVVRGGSWSLIGRHCRTARRSSADPGRHSSDIGFRVVFVP